MGKKKAIKLATATAIAASAFVAVAPTQSEAATSIATQVKKAKAAMKKPYTTYFEATKLASVATVEKEIAAAEKSYKNVKAAIKKSSDSKAKKDAYYKELKGYEKYITRAEGYVKGYKAAKKAEKSLSSDLTELNAAAIAQNPADVKKKYNALDAAVVKADKAIKDTVYGANIENLLYDKFTAATKTALNGQIKAYYYYEKAEYWLDKEDTVTAEKRIKTASAIKLDSTELGKAIEVYAKKVQTKYDQATDKVAPEFTYKGELKFEVENGAEFKLPEVEAKDKDDLNEVKVTSKVEGPKGATEIDTKVAGEYKVTYTATDAKGNKAEDLVITVVVKEATPAVKSVSAINVNKIAVTFNKAVEDTKAKFEVKRGSVTEDVKVTWNEAKTIATLEKTGNFTPAEYVVTVSGIEGLKDASKTVKVEAEEIKEVKITNEALQKSLTAPVSLEFINQYGEKATISASDSKLTITAYNKTQGRSVSRVPNQFQLNANSETLKDEIVVTVMYNDVVKTKTLNLVGAATVGSVSLGDVVLPKGKSMFTPSGTKDVEIKYTATNTLEESYKLVQNDKDTSAVQFLSSDNNILDPADITINSDNQIKVAKFGKAGTVTLTAFTPATGKVSKVTIEVKEDAGAPYAVALDKTTAQFAAGSTSDFYLVPKVTDKYNTEIALKDLKSTDYVISSTNTNVATVGFETTPGTDFGKIKVTPVAGATKGQSAIITVIVKSTGQQAQATVSASEAAVPTSLELKKNVTAPTSLLVGASKTLSFDAIDQYGATIGSYAGYTVDYTTSDANVIELGSGEAGDALSSATVSFTAKKAGSATVKAVLKNRGVAVAEKVYNVNVIANDSTKVSYSVSDVNPVYKGVADNTLVGGTLNTGDGLSTAEKTLLVDSGYAEEIKLTAKDSSGNEVPVPVSAVVKTDLTQPSAADGQTRLTGALDVFEYNGKHYVYSKTGFIPADFNTTAGAKDIKGKVSFTINADDAVKVVSQDITVSKDNAVAQSIEFKNKAWNAVDADEATDVISGSIANLAEYADPTTTLFTWTKDQFGGYTAVSPTLSLVNVDGTTNISNDVATITTGNLTIADNGASADDTVFTKNDAKFRLIAQAGSQTDFVTFTVADGIAPTPLAYNATTAPTSFKVVSPTSITVKFSEGLDATKFAANNANGFSVGGGSATLTKAELGNDKVTVTLTGANFLAGTTTIAYTAPGTAADLIDLAGNKLATFAATATN